MCPPSVWYLSSMIIVAVLPISIPTLRDLSRVSKGLKVPSCLATMSMLLSGTHWNPWRKRFFRKYRVSAVDISLVSDQTRVFQQHIIAFLKSEFAIKVGFHSYFYSLFKNPLFWVICFERQFLIFRENLPKIITRSSPSGVAPGYSFLLDSWFDETLTLFWTWLFLLSRCFLVFNTWMILKFW